MKALAQVAVQSEKGSFPEEGLRALEQGMADTNPVVQLASVMALGQVGMPALELLIHALKTTENVAVATSIANTLGSISDPKSVAALKEVIADDATDPYVKELAESSLGRMNMFPANA